MSLKEFYIENKYDRCDRQIKFQIREYTIDINMNVALIRHYINYYPSFIYKYANYIKLFFERITPFIVFIV